MANTNAPFGFLPIAPNGAALTPSYGLITAVIDKDNTNVIAKGDPALKLATGYVDRINTTNDNTANAHLYAGIFWGCSYLSIAQGRKVNSSYWPGSDAANDVTAFLLPLAGAPAMQFLVQSDGSPFTFADIGQNCYPLYAAPTAQGVHRRSGVTLDQGELAVTAGIPWKIEGLYSDIAAPGENGTDDTSNFNIAIVSFNAYQMTGI